MSKLATESYNFRLDPRIAKEKAAIDSLAGWKKQGFTVRQIVTELILSQQDIELPEPANDTLSAKAVRRLEDLIADQVMTILRDIRDRNPLALNTFVKLPASDGGEELIDDATREALQRARRGRSLKRSDIE